MSNATWMTLLVRLTLGLMFFAHGLGKFPKYASVVEGISGKFAETWLPQFIVMPFAYVLPVWEFAMGVLLLLGLWYRPTLIATGVLIAILSFGQIVQGNPGGASANLAYLIIILIGIRYSNENRWAVGK